MSDYIKNAMGAACGVMGWAPDAFWAATPLDVQCAWDGFQMFHGFSARDAFSHEDARELRQILDKHLHG